MSGYDPKRRNMANIGLALLLAAVALGVYAAFFFVMS